MATHDHAGSPLVVLGRVRARVRCDAHALIGGSWSVWRAGRLRAVPMTIVWSVLVIVFALLVRDASGARWVGDWASEQAGSSWWRFLVRLPGSLFAPAELLPTWAAWAQVTVVIGSFELLLGWRRTVLVSAVCHALSTMAARFFVELGPRWVFGLADSYRHVADTGPSAATIGLGMYVAVVKRTPTLFAVLVIYGALESRVVWGLAQREHIVAALAGLALGALMPADAPRPTNRPSEGRP
jgi:hypothetical protein